MTPFRMPVQKCLLRRNSEARLAVRVIFRDLLPALVAQQFSEWLHGASAAVREKPGAAGVPLVEMIEANQWLSPPFTPI